MSILCPALRLLCVYSSMGTASRFPPIVYAKHELCFDIVSCQISETKLFPILAAYTCEECSMLGSTGRFH